MYSHELQTCDWPRNVGCGGESEVSDGNGGGIVATVSTVRVTDSRTRQSSNLRTAAPVQRERPLQREAIPKHHLYTEEDLGPAEEIESDRQQRVYRGQPATLGQVARDRDGLNRHTNAIQPAPGNGREKLSVVSFGTQQQYSTDSQTANKKTKSLTNKNKRTKRQTRFSFPAQARIIHTNPTTAPLITWSSPPPHFSIPFIPPHFTPSTHNIHYHNYHGLNRFESIPRNYKQNHQQNLNTQFSKPLRFPVEGDDDFVPVLGTRPRVNLPPPAPEFLITPRPFQNNSNPNDNLKNYVFQNLNGIVSTQPSNLGHGPDNYAYLHFGAPSFSVDPRTVKPDFNKSSPPQTVLPNLEIHKNHDFNTNKSTEFKVNTESSTKHNTTNLRDIKTEASSNIINKYNQNRTQEINNKIRKFMPELSYSSSNINESIVAAPTNNEESEGSDEYDEEEEETDSDEEKGKEEENEKQNKDSQEGSDDESENQDEENDEDSNNEEESDTSGDLERPEFPSPPKEFFDDPSEKYLNIDNPFSDPDFDFDKFLYELSDHDQSEQNVAPSNTTTVISNDENKQNPMPSNHKYDTDDKEMEGVLTERKGFRPYTEVQGTVNTSEIGSSLKQNKFKKYNTDKEIDSHRATVEEQHPPNHRRYNNQNDGRKYRRKTVMRTQTHTTNAPEIWLTDSSRSKTTLNYQPTENEQSRFKVNKNRYTSNHPKRNHLRLKNKISSIEHSDSTEDTIKEFTTLKSQDVLTEPFTKDNYEHTTPLTLFSTEHNRIVSDFTTQNTEGTKTFISLPANHRYDADFTPEITTSTLTSSEHVFKGFIGTLKDTEPYITNSALTAETTTEPTMYSVHQKYSLSELPTTNITDVADDDEEYYDDDEYDYSVEDSPEYLQLPEVKPVSPPDAPKKFKDIDNIQFKKPVSDEEYDEASDEDEYYEYEEDEGINGRNKSKTDEDQSDYYEDDVESPAVEKPHPHQYEVVEDIAESKRTDWTTTTEYLPITENIHKLQNSPSSSSPTPHVGKNETETVILTSTVRYRKKYRTTPASPTTTTSTETNFNRNTINDVKRKPSRKRYTTKRPIMTSTTDNKKFRGSSRFNNTIASSNKYEITVSPHSIKNRRKNILPSRSRINLIKNNISETIPKARRYNARKRTYPLKTTVSLPDPSQSPNITRQTNIETQASSLRLLATTEILSTTTETPSTSETTTHDIDTSESKEKAISLNMYEYQLTNRLNLVPDGRATIAPPTYVEQQSTTVRPVSRGYNSSQQQYSQQQQQYDPYYNLYEDDAEIYKDIDYGQYSSQQTQNQNQQQFRGQYKDKQREQVIQQQVIQQQAPQRKPTYIQPQQQQQQQSYSVPDVYSQSVSAQDYNDNYNLQVDDDVQYTKQSDLDIKLNRSVPSKTPEADSEESGSDEVAPNPEATNPVALALKAPPNTSRRLTLTAAFSLENSNSPVNSSKIVQSNQNNGRQKKTTNYFTVQSNDDNSDQTHRELILSYIDEDNPNKPKNRLRLQPDNKPRRSNTYDTKEDNSKPQTYTNSRERFLNEQIKAINNLEEKISSTKIIPSESPFYVRKAERNRNVENREQVSVEDGLKIPQIKSSPRPFRLIIGVGRSSIPNKETKDTIQSDYVTEHAVTPVNVNKLHTQEIYTSTLPSIIKAEKPRKDRIRNPFPQNTNNKDTDGNDRNLSVAGYRIISTTDSSVDETSKQIRIRSRNRLPDNRRNEYNDLNERSQGHVISRTPDYRVVATTEDPTNTDFTTEQTLRSRFRNPVSETTNVNNEKITETKENYRKVEASTISSDIYVTPKQSFKIQIQDSITDKPVDVDERSKLRNSYRLITTTEHISFDVTTERNSRGRLQSTTSESSAYRNRGLSERFQSRVNNYRIHTTTEPNETPVQLFTNQLPETRNIDDENYNGNLQINDRIPTTTEQNVDVTPSQVYRSEVQKPLENAHSSNYNRNERFQNRANRYRIISSTEANNIDSKTDEYISSTQNPLQRESIEDVDNNRKISYPENDQLSTSTEQNLLLISTERSYRRRPLNPKSESVDIVDHSSLNAPFQSTTESYSSETNSELVYRTRGQTKIDKNESLPVLPTSRRFISRSTTQPPQIETSTNYNRLNYFGRERNNQNVFSNNRESNHVVPTLSTLLVTNEIDSNNYQAPLDVSVVPTEYTQFERGNEQQSPAVAGISTDSRLPLQSDALSEVRIETVDNIKGNNEYSFKSRHGGRNNLRGRPQYRTTTEAESYDDYDETSFEVRQETDASTTQRSKTRQHVRDWTLTDTKVSDDNTSAKSYKPIPEIIAIEIQPVSKSKKLNKEVPDISELRDSFDIDIPVPSKPFLQAELAQENVRPKESKDVIPTGNSLPISFRQRENIEKISNNLSGLNIPVTSPGASSVIGNSPVRSYTKSRVPVKNNDPIEIENSEPNPNPEINSKTYHNTSKNMIVKPSLTLKSQILRSELENNARPRAPVRCSQLDSECNEKSFVRGNGRNRGSATYTISPNEAEPAPAINRGTPSSIGRNRPTLKPSTSIVSKAQEFVDIYKFPPSRPEPIYPTPQVDKTAAKCRKDVCLLPDCSCGGKDIPGDLTPEETPQLVLLTFDDSVNDLNKGLYSDLFDKGRTNPNGCPISATFYVSHEWTDYSQVQNLYATGHEIASHSVSHSFGEQFSQKKWTREIAGQREILSAYGGVRQEDIRGMRAPFLAVGGNKMFKMLYDSNFTYDSSMPVYENKPPSWPYTLDYKIFHDCMIPPCPTRSYPGVWEVPMVMWQDLNGGRCSMGDACSNPPTSDGVYKMLIKNFERHFTSNRAPFGLFYHAAWFTQPHHKEGFIAFLDTIVNMPEVWVVTNWQALQWVRDPTPISRLNGFGPFQCNYPERPRKCNNPKVCNLWHKSGVRYMRTCQPCPDIYPWTGKSGVRTSRVDNEIINE